MADAASMAKAVNADINALESAGILAKMVAGLEPKAEAAAKEEALGIYTALAQTVGLKAEPYLVANLAAVLDLHSDKAKPVQAAAETAGRALSAMLNPHAVKKVRVAPPGSGTHKYSLCRGGPAAAGHVRGLFPRPRPAHAHFSAFVHLQRPLRFRSLAKKGNWWSAPLQHRCCRSSSLPWIPQRTGRRRKAL